ncbi:MAG: hypothetical protein KF905_15685 [Flavobacteriales bacterium]|nr:hypothetical protein [Flavobacteriales bacterium]
MDIKGAAMDHMGHFAPHDIGNGLFALFIAAMLGLAIGSIGWRGARALSLELAAWGMLAALAMFLVRGQLAVAVALLAVVLVVRSTRARSAEDLPLIAALLLGAGCGSGASLIMLPMALPVLLVLRMARPSAAS